ncbi:hypothetical protein AUJ95_00560 [Candidatus Desantisbacteria bacterium CG2_30_40_21]|uniref:Fibronectin type-III domain-containing protein n=6 Tax=unclassified Candidatus Desantisiibacteriota TaxID=3106372 RepID=A0A2M7P471_9BACT|nr:MAG: hypothetical protein AUJ95_00560 [Candidatus Desantisbacteria bacterium CG2_30_40_21]PIP39224.1 MAG: hypothetical protein COX18_10810 [Candidatus Desantisbacteria bacterium CG23_combo_of_CG06-09_8_20_14_all_40_23]PIY20316.1 MAG: hypothetical protein COZ13_01100 [Candidatus Desantisbacteria bacterium CG_4_10_14_3_um_filter_40_18]PJB29162.1 MAG: hypothetical protein CO110_07245 [Candidatus Desantisbacteria bacterium CG_4_9_14_3_um_filter_40_11]
MNIQRQIKRLLLFMLIAQGLWAGMQRDLWAEETYFMQTKWGNNGSGDGQFNYPYGVAVDSSGNVFVAEYNSHRIQKFTADGTFITKWGSPGSGIGQFNDPRGLSVDSSGNVFVVDQSNRCIQKFTADGTFITKWGSPGSGDEQFRNPLGVAVDSSDNVFVVDYGNHRIQKFNKSYPSGWLSGKVTNSADNKAINRAMVEVSNNEAMRFSTTTGTNGNYCLFVPAGNCTVRVTTSGYSSTETIGVVITENATTTVNFSLVAGTITVDTTPPTGKPSVPTATGNPLSTTLTFSWNKGAADDAEAGIGGYRLQVKGDKGGTVIGTIFDGNVGNILAYTTINATNSLTYSARVKAINGCGLEAMDDYWSGWSDGITVDTTPPQPPTIDLPAETKETKVKSGEITLTGKTEPEATLSEIIIRDQSENILSKEIYTATIDPQGSISVTIDSGKLARNYPLSSQIIIKITIKDNAGNLTTSYSSWISFSASSGERFMLYNNLFDPTKNEKVIIKYELTENTEVSIVIYDFRGNLIKTLVDTYQGIGIYTKTWDGRNDSGEIVSSGIYLVQIKAGGFKEIKKIAVVE